MSEREMLMNRIAAIDFAVADLSLYMDSHPNDTDVNRILQEYLNKSMELHNEYEDSYGPLTSENMDENRWGWISDPWPWDKSGRGQ